MKTTISLITILAFFLIFNINATAQKNSQTDLKATVAGLSSGEISKELFLNTGKVQCTDSKFEIINYHLSVKKDSDIIDFYGSGNTFTTVMKDLVKEMKSGSKIVIEKINAKSMEGTEIKLPLIVLVLK